jgi:hypothetical protein
MKTRLINVPIDLDEEIEKKREEQVKLTVENYETQKETYLALKQRNLPIPAALSALFDPKVANAPEVEAAGSQARMPQLGLDDPANPAIAPTGYDMMTPAGMPVPDPGTASQEMAMQDPNQMGDGSGASVRQLPRNRAMPGQRRRPEESDEMRRGMPVASRKADAGTDEELPPPAFMSPAHIGSRRSAGVRADVPLDEGDREVG